MRDVQKIVYIKFDDKIQRLEMVDEKHYKLIYQEQDKELSDSELVYMLSSGTTKGVLLYIFVVAALKQGFDLLIDEVENHFHKILVFTTHYCEVLDIFNRQDNIWIAKSDDKVHLDNVYEKYDIRLELLKSRQFYNNAFNTVKLFECYWNMTN